MDFSSITPIIISLASITITAYVAITAKHQTKINEEKLRLDLYNRRFEIYSKSLDFYQALTGYFSVPKDYYISLRNDFIKTYRESQFLFDSESGIYQILEEMHTKSFIIAASFDYGKQLADADPDGFLRENKKFEDALKWLNEEAIVKLEQAMAPYLKFHKIAA